MQNARLDESQAGIKVILYMAESEEELKSLWMRVKEESEEPGLKLSIKKTKVPSLHGK